MRQQNCSFFSLQEDKDALCWPHVALPVSAPADQHDIHRQTNPNRASSPRTCSVQDVQADNPKCLQTAHSPLYLASPECACVQHPGLRYQVTGNQEAQLTTILGYWGQGHRQPQPRPSSGAAKSQTPHLEAPAARGTGQTLCEQPRPYPDLQDSLL